MFRIQALLLLLVLCAGCSEAWFWYSTSEGTTPIPVTAVTETTGATTTSSGTKKKEEEDDNLSGVGEEILNVATGIRKFVEAWAGTETTTTVQTPEKVESADSNATGNLDMSEGKRVEEGPGVWAGGSSKSGSGSGSGSGDLAADLGSGVSLINTAEPSCLPVPSDSPICLGKQPAFFTLPNFVNHTSVDEVRAALHEWAWLAYTGCHRGIEWFLCLLLVPQCPLPNVPLYLPCRSFCHVLRDSCWASLEDGGLPVECDLLPERAEEPACASVSNCKGNPGGLECIL